MHFDKEIMWLIPAFIVHQPDQEHIEPTEWARERVTPYTRNTTAKSKHGGRLIWEPSLFCCPPLLELAAC